MYRGLAHQSQRRGRVRLVRLVLVAVLVQSIALPAHAGSLKSLFDRVLRFEGELSQFPGFRQELEEVIVRFERNAVRTADFVATATAAGFAFTWDPETESLKRAERSLGSVFLESADMIGKGRFYVSFAYLYSEFTEIDGESLEDSLDELRDVRGPDQLDIATEKFDFRSQVFTASATYGLTKDWDVNVLVPLFVTTLKLRGESALLIPGAPAFRNPFVANETKTGLGDILLRTKYRFADRAGVQLAGGFILRVPSGEPDDFQGLGDVTLTPMLIAQRAVGRHLLQANVGVEVNAGDLEQTRARYAVGATVHVVRFLDLLAHVVGNSGFTDDEFREGDVSGVVGRTDIVDAIAGIEVAFTDDVVAQVGAIVPLTDDGLRADVVPVGWIGARF
jgi:hypothetical protein